MLRHLTRLWNDALDFIYPPHCLLCAADEHALMTPHVCQRCLDSLRGEPLLSPFDLADQFAHRNIDHSVDKCYAAWPFSEKIQKLVHAMKYDGKPSLARVLARGMSARIDPIVSEKKLIVPVPMHRRRQRERGYNQSALLSVELAKLLNIAVNRRALSRARDTVQQALLPSAQERRSNVENAFIVKSPAAFAGKTVLLIDDVVTTGSTVNACAQVLKAAGAIRVCVLAVARA